MSQSVREKRVRHSMSVFTWDHRYRTNCWRCWFKLDSDQTGDMKQASLQIRIREDDRLTLRFHDVSDLETRRAETFRFGLAPSPLLLAGVIKQHLETCRDKFPHLITDIDKSLYVDDLVSGGPAVREKLKLVLFTCLSKPQSSYTSGSNVSELEALEYYMSEETVFAKEQLGSLKAEGGSINHGIKMTILYRDKIPCCSLEYYQERNAR